MICDPSEGIGSERRGEPEFAVGDAGGLDLGVVLHDVLESELAVLDDQDAVPVPERLAVLALARAYDVEQFALHAFDLLC